MTTKELIESLIPYGWSYRKAGPLVYITTRQCKLTTNVKHLARAIAFLHLLRLHDDQISNDSDEIEQQLNELRAILLELKP